MDLAVVSIVISIVGFIGTVGTLAFTGSWRLRSELSNQREAFSKELGRLRDSLSKDLTTHQTQDDTEFAKIRHEFGETVTAIRYGLAQTELASTNRINQVEVQSADKFIRRESFYQVVADLKENAALMRSDIRDLIRRTDQHLAALMGRPVIVPDTDQGRSKQPPP